MALTRRLLKELELSEDAIERVIAAHAATVEALRTERDAAIQAAQGYEQAAAEREEMRRAAEEHRQEAERLRGEYDQFRQETERQQGLRREAALASALRRAGANEQAIPLLAKTIPLAEMPWEGDALQDEAAALSGVKAAYAAFFASPEPLPTDRCTPPLAEEMLSAEDVRRMSAEEINRHWAQVKDALLVR